MLTKTVLNEMKISDEQYLKQVKNILLKLNLVKPETVLDSKSWIQFYRDGYNPGQAIKEDMGLSKLPHIVWSPLK